MRNNGSVQALDIPQDLKIVQNRLGNVYERLLICHASVGIFL
jgi:hypothetical protein